MQNCKSTHNPRSRLILSAMPYCGSWSMTLQDWAPTVAVRASHLQRFETSAIPNHLEWGETVRSCLTLTFSLKIISVSGERFPCGVPGVRERTANVIEAMSLRQTVSTNRTQGAEIISWNYIWGWMSERGPSVLRSSPALYFHSGTSLIYIALRVFHVFHFIFISIRRRYRTRPQNLRTILL